jgi:hypothetical protein
MMQAFYELEIQGNSERLDTLIEGLFMHNDIFYFYNIVKMIIINLF